MPRDLALSPIALLIACGASQTPSDDAPSRATLAIKDVRVFDGEKTLPEATVLIANDQIVGVGRGLAVPPNADVIDGADHTLLPGFIDAHTHAWGSGPLRQALALGVTTELDMMGDVRLAAQQRARRPSDQASLYTAGNPVTVPGGHGTEYGKPVPTVEPGEDMAAFVAARVAEGSDYIKIVFDDGTAWGGEIPTLTPDMVAAAVESAHAHRRLAVTHIATAEEAKVALEAGSDALAHIYFGGANPALARQMKESGAAMVPTLSVMRSACGASPGRALLESEALERYIGITARANLSKRFPMVGERPECSQFTAAVRELHAAGVPILAGTDCPNPGTAHGVSIHGELALLVDAGLSEEEALRAATAAPARVFRFTDRGRIKEGYRADLILVRGDPTTDIAATMDIQRVWKAGEPFDRDAFAAEIDSQHAVSAAEIGESGLVSDFNGDEITAAFGSGWSVSTDELRGGSSTASMELEDGALAVSGEVRKSHAPWAGVMFSPGSSPTSPADLSDKRGIRFRARGDGKTYAIMLFTQSGGITPSMQTFQAGSEWSEHEIPFERFGGSDGSDVIGIFWGAGRPGEFSLQIDDVALW